MDRLSRNTELQSRKEQATARGVGVMTQVFAARAENADTALAVSEVRR